MGVQEWKMKPVRLTIAVLSVAALMCFGCASLRPSAANRPTVQQELAQDQPDKNPDHGNYWGVGLSYWMLYIGGQALASK